MGSRSGLVYKTGKALKSGSGPLIIVGFKSCVLVRMQIKKCTCRMLRTQRTASLRHVNVP
jgi:hypothetical protein